MSEPKFSVGQAVMIRCKGRPEYDCDFDIVTAAYYGEYYDHNGVVNCEWVYLTDRCSLPDNDFFGEEVLRPIPPEKHRGIDATEYIKSLKGEGVKA